MEIYRFAKAQVRLRPRVRETANDRVSLVRESVKRRFFYVLCRIDSF